MTATPASRAALKKSSGEAWQKSEDRIEKALREMVRDGADITVQGVARRAKVSRATVYRHQEQLKQVKRQRAVPATRVDDTVPPATRPRDRSSEQDDPTVGVVAALHRRVREQQTQITELHRDIKQLKDTIARLHGEIDDLSPD